MEAVEIFLTYLVAARDIWYNMLIFVSFRGDTV